MMLIIDAKLNSEINVSDSDGLNKIKQNSYDADIYKFLAVKIPFHHLKRHTDVNNIH